MIRPAVTGEWYWIADATVEANTVKVLVNRYRKTGEGSLDFALTGTALATLALPGLTVSNVVELPLGDKIAWGAALLEDGAYTYVYGSEYVAADAMRFARLARVPAGGLSGAWEFWTGNGWSTSSAASARLPLSGVGTSFGVQKVGSQYVLVTMECNIPFGSQAVAYTANSPQGPFTGPVDLFTAPEPQAREGVIVYDTRVHPELAPSGKLLVSYNVHSLNGDDLYDDARIYRPRFVDLTWPKPIPDPSTVPAAPSSLSATTDETGAIHLSWPAVSGTQLTYNIYQRDVTAGQTHFARIARPTATSQSLGGFKTGHTYEFKVSASNAAGEGPPSPTRSVAVTIAPPAAPTGVSASAGTDGSITVSWSPVPHAWRYDVLRRDVTAGETELVPINDPSPADTTVTALWLTHNHEYEFVVTASHGGGTSSGSAPARATARYAVPPAPAGLTATPLNDGQIRLTWSGPAQNVYFLVFQRDVTAGETAFTQLPLPVGCCEMTAGYLLHGHEYEYKVVASNSGGESPPSNLARATSTYPPTLPPGTLQAVPGSGEVRLTWGASATPDAWYWVYQRDVTAGESGFTRLPLPIASCCTMTAGYLANDHTYEFQLTAIGPAGESGPSNVVTATPRLPLPGQVTGLTVTQLGTGELRLNWTAPGPDLYFWIYQRDVTAGETAFTKLPYPVGTCCTFTAGLLKHNHVYEFKVAASNATGDGPASAPARGTAFYQKPGAPTNLRAVAAGDGSIDLDWDAPGPNVMYWIYQRDVTAGETAFTRSVYPTENTWASRGWLVHGHSYEFKVTAENQGGEGPASATVRAVSVGGLPQPPSGLTATAGDGQVTLRWNASPSPNVWYWIEQRPSGGTWQRLKYPLTTCCTFTAGYLMNGTTYEFRVRATNMTGDSAASNVASARPMPPFPQAPTNLRATANGDTAVNLSWTASSTGNVYYWIYYRYAGTSSWTRARYPLTGCCSFTLSMLTPGRSYEFHLRAENLSGLSAPSNVVGVTLVVTPPGSPGSVRAVPQTTSSDVWVYWGGVSRATGYTVEAKLCRGGSWQVVGFMITSTAYRVGYAAGCYVYRVTADRFGVYGPESSEKLAFGTVDDYPWGSGFPWIDKYGFVLQQCTSFVASRVDKYYPYDPPGFTSLNYWHAKNWDEAARKYGGMVSHTPAVGAIAQWNGGSYGHVAWVAGIDGSDIIIEEYNYTNPRAYSRRRISGYNVDNYLVLM